VLVLVLVLVFCLVLQACASGEWVWSGFQSTDYLGKVLDHLLWHGMVWSIMSTWGVFDKNI